MYAPPHRSACIFSPRCLPPPLGCPPPSTRVHRKVRHFASCCDSISPSLCAQLERSPPLIKLITKKTRFSVIVPVTVQLFKIDLSFFSEHLYGYSALVAPLVCLVRLPYISQNISLSSCTTLDPEEEEGEIDLLEMVMAGGNGTSTSSNHVNEYYKCCVSQFFIQIVVIAMLVVFAGMMSGLTLGLMSMSLVDLEVLAKSGTPKDRLHASKILPVVKRQHLLLCTLLISNAAAMEALPIFLDKLVPDWGAILISVTLILVFGEIIPQSVCSRYGLVIGAAVAPIIRVLVWICFPIAYPISKLLDLLLGNGHEPLFRRAELKTLVDFHSAEGCIKLDDHLSNRTQTTAGKGGDLSLDETTIIAGALELTEKTARDAMTPLSETFAVDINAKLDRDLINLIMEMGHSRVPVYYEQPRNIIGLVLVKNLLTVNPADGRPVKNATIRRIPRSQPYGSRYKNSNQPAITKLIVKSMREVRLNIYNERPQNKTLNSKRTLQNLKNLPGSANVSCRVSSKSKRWSDHFHSEVLQINDNSLSALTADGDVIGIITMEDVIEKLLKEEIYDETDHRDSHS
ncbi:CBS domain protein [Actinidia rufa]|uniref:CBS domain protein n=1 Tax=Actinidia rufa TaxID=165716 RepID=A0A7J0EX43_9ERIC|nr:CBS domain protein [Actinidia rufa]